MHRIILAAQKPLVLEGYCVGKPKERHVKSLPCLRLLGEFGWKLLTQVASTTFHKGWNHLHTGLGEPLRICLNNHGPSPDVNFISRCYIEVSDFRPAIVLLHVWLHISKAFEVFEGRYFQQTIRHVLHVQFSQRVLSWLSRWDRAQSVMITTLATWQHKEMVTDDLMGI